MNNHTDRSIPSSADGFDSPDTFDELVDRVVREAGERCSPDTPFAPLLHGCARDAVAELTGGTVATFVPLLALRRVQACIDAGHCGTSQD